MRAYSQDLRDRVIAQYKTNKYNITELVLFFNISRQTISDWISRYKSTGDYSSKQHMGSGVKRKFDNKEKVLAYIKNNPNADGIRIRDNVAPGLAMSTFYDTLKRMGITYKKRAKI